jgi:hypothetical protein
MGILSGPLPHDAKRPGLEAEHSSHPTSRLPMRGKLILTTRLSVPLNTTSSFRGHAVRRSWPHGSVTSGGSRPCSVQYRIRGSCLCEVHTIVPLCIVPWPMLTSTCDSSNRRQGYCVTEDTTWPPSWEVRQTPGNKVGVMPARKVTAVSTYTCKHLYIILLIMYTTRFIIKERRILHTVRWHVLCDSLNVRCLFL